MEMRYNFVNLSLTSLGLWGFQRTRAHLCELYDNLFDYESIMFSEEMKM